LELNSDTDDERFGLNSGSSVARGNNQVDSDGSRFKLDSDPNDPGFDLDSRTDRNRSGNALDSDESRFDLNSDPDDPRLDLDDSDAGVDGDEYIGRNRRKDGSDFQTGRDPQP